MQTGEWSCPRVDSLYDIDEHRWIEQQVSLLEGGDLSALDRAHLIEFLTAMAARDKRAIQSRLTVLLAHVLKVQFQPSHISRSWASTIQEQQRKIRLMIQSVPSLRQYVDTIYAEAYEDAVKEAAIQTGIPISQFGLPAQYISYDGAMGFDAQSLKMP